MGVLLILGEKATNRMSAVSTMGSDTVSPSRTVCCTLRSLYFTAMLPRFMPLF